MRAASIAELAAMTSSCRLFERASLAATAAFSRAASSAVAAALRLVKVAAAPTSSLSFGSFFTTS